MHKMAIGMKMKLKIVLCSGKERKGFRVALKSFRGAVIAIENCMQGNFAKRNTPIARK